LDDEEFSLDAGTSVESVPVQIVPEPVVEAKAVVEIPAATVSVTESAPTVSLAPAPTTESTSDAPTSSAAQAVSVAADDETSKKLQRAARFGIEPVPVAVAKVEQDKKAQRAARFGLPEKVESAPVAAGKKGGKKGQQAAAEMAVDPATMERLKARAERFGVVSPLLQATVSEETKAAEVYFCAWHCTTTTKLYFSLQANKLQKRKERFNSGEQQEKQSAEVSELAQK